MIKHPQRQIIILAIMSILIATSAHAQTITTKFRDKFDAQDYIDDHQRMAESSEQFIHIVKRFDNIMTTHQAQWTKANNTSENDAEIKEKFWVNVRAFDKLKAEFAVAIKSADGLVASAIYKDTRAMAKDVSRVLKEHRRLVDVLERAFNDLDIDALDEAKEGREYLVKSFNNSWNNAAEVTDKNILSAKIAIGNLIFPYGSRVKNKKDEPKCGPVGSRQHDIGCIPHLSFSD